MANITDFIGDLQLPIDCDFNGDVDEEKVFMRLVAEYWNNHEDEKNADLKSLPWREDNNSPTPTASDSGVSSNCSIISDDMAISPQTQFVRVAFTTAVFATNNNSHNGHKKLNRSQSEPRARYNKHNSGGSASLRYKTELCHPFEENGVCKYGEKCQFAHGVHELRHLARHPKYKSELCRTFHAEGYCPYGTRCHFIHGDSSTKTKPAALSLYPTIPSASSVKDLSQSPSSLSSLSPASSMTVFSFAAPLLQMSPVCSPPPSPTEARLPIFNEISAPALRSYGQFGGLTA